MKFCSKWFGGQQFENKPRSRDDMSNATISNRRTVDGVELPAAGTYELDPSHTTAAFTARHLMVSKVRGRFASVRGTIEIGDDPAESSVVVTIDAASIDTRDDTRDEHLRSADFLHVENHPTLEFRSRSVTPTSPGTWAVDGDLTIRGESRPVRLDVTLEGVVTDPWGNQRAGFSASTEIDREDWGLTWNVALETGGVLVGRKVRIDIDAEAVLQTQA
jgi:polyisoprenoid-binding protein YceI